MSVIIFKKMKNKFNWNNFVLSFLGGVFVAFILFVSFTMLVTKGVSQNYENIIWDKMLKDHFVNNNLEILDEKDINNQWYSDRNIYMYNLYIQDNYKYVTGTYDCKYYSLMYVLWAKKHNIEYRYLVFDKHISVVLEFDNKYCIADQNILNCVYLD